MFTIQLLKEYYNETKILKHLYMKTIVPGLEINSNLD
jgi:hypothetical protein